ncbi:helix-turn-helix domain-containing protein [Anaerocolumna sp. MB42-C2]|uniref:helix-turn-helix domain-containing protein n=1 Tax=Anaerocolumna sp. MB42-C2 TaxID=3070997 RepID=UPI0027E0CF94|nr:helix-turn-helix transcriptional regulator [Anaerocolumna sp. MB42-C2]WMJ90633.1 helix-turn-helix transcriptional regulator [Anaerocolumna sp. MB42-C2]
MSVLQERIKERRLTLGMTLLEVANQLGVKEATMQRYESGEIKNVKHETITKLAEVFQCSPSYLMGWEEIQPVPTIAAHKEDNENWTAEELSKIEEYKQLLLAARNNKH